MITGVPCHPIHKAAVKVLRSKTKVKVLSGVGRSEKRYKQLQAFTSISKEEAL